MSGSSHLRWQPGETVVFAGDSITDAGLAFDGIRPFGEGFVRNVVDLLWARYPRHGLSFYNTGVSGSTIGHVRDRWERDVVARTPDWVVLLVGVNDLNHFVAGDQRGLGVMEFGEIHADLIARGREVGARFVLMDPFLMASPDTTDLVDRERLIALGEYRRVIADAAARMDAPHVPLHDILQEQLEVRTDGPFYKEVVHPNARGHLVIAHALLSAIGW
ncbi:MAG: acyl-CoA thioesterase-1 [Glaciecola sp.]|jgi:acyl-CoA thioesterase-1